MIIQCTQCVAVFITWFTNRETISV